MRAHMSLVEILAAAAAAAVAGWTGGFAAPTSAPLFADNRPSAVPVDTELVLAVDISYSMDPDRIEQVQWTEPPRSR